MSIALEQSRFAYTGDGAQLSFPYPTKFFQDADLVVTVDGATQTLTTHYTVTGAGAIVGGSVNFLTAPADDSEIVIWLEPPFVQELDYVPNDAFPAESHENGLDKLTQQTRYLLEQVMRAFRLPMTEGQVAAITAAARAGKLLGFDSTGAIKFYVPSEAGAASALGYVLFENAAARAAATPAFLGQLGIQVDTLAPYIGNATTPGAWTPALGGGGGPIELNDLDQSGAAVGQIPKWNGAIWAPANDETGTSLAGAAAVVVNFTQLVAAITAANADTGPKTILANGEFLFTDHLTNTSGSGADLSVHDDIVIQPTLGARFDFRRNVFGPYKETIVTGNAAADLVFNITGHPFVNGACLRLRSNGPLPVLSGGARMSTNTAYYVVQATANTFKLSLTRGGAALVSGQTIKNLTEIWFYCAVDSADVSNSTEGKVQFSITSHGVLEHARVYFQTSPAGGALPTGITSGTGGRYYAINVTANSFEVTTVPGAQGSRVVFAGAGTGEGHIFVQHFMMQLDGSFEGRNEQHFRNFLTGYEVTDTIQRGVPSVFGMFGGQTRNMVWWTGFPEAGFDDYAMNVLGLYTSGGAGLGNYLRDQRLKDSTDGFRAACNSYTRIRGKAGETPVDPQGFFQSSFAHSEVLFPAGVLRLTDFVSYQDNRGMRTLGKGVNNTVIMWDQWRGNPSLHARGEAASGPAWGCFVYKESNAGAYFEGFSISTTTRTPGNSALLYIPHGGTLENARFVNIRCIAYKRYGICLGPQVTNHCKFIDIYIQNCMHPWSAAFGGIFGSGSHKFTLEGATLNSGGRSPYNAQRGFELANIAEARITRVHYEQTFGGLEYFAEGTGMVTADQHDGIRLTSIFHLCEPIGGNEFLLWPLSVSNKRKLVSPVMGASTMQFTTQWFVSGVYANVDHGLVVGDYVALFGHAADCTADATGGTVEDMISLTAHGFSNQDPVVFYDTGTTFPAGLTAGTIYYAIVADPNYFRVSLTAGGAAVDITADGDCKVGSPLAGVYRCATGTTASTLIVDVPSVSQAGLKTVPGSLAATTELRSMQVRQFRNSVGNRDPLMFDSGVLGTIDAPVGLDAQTFYWTHGATLVELNAVESFVAGSPIITAVAHGLVDNDVVFVSPCVCASNAPSDLMMPGGIDSIRPYWVQRLSADTFQLHTAPGLPFAAPVFGTPVTVTEESRVDGNGTLGDESTYYVSRMRYKCAINVDLARDGTAKTFTGTIPALVTRATFVGQFGQGTHLIKMESCSLERGQDANDLVDGAGTRRYLCVHTVMPLVNDDASPWVLPHNAETNTFPSSVATLETDGLSWDISLANH